jgi:hypothetical protein
MWQVKLIRGQAVLLQLLLLLVFLVVFQVVLIPVCQLLVVVQRPREPIRAWKLLVLPSGLVALKLWLQLLLLLLLRLLWVVV